MTPRRIGFPSSKRSDGTTDDSADRANGVPTVGRESGRDEMNARPDIACEQRFCWFLLVFSCFLSVFEGFQHILPRN